MTTPLNDKARTQFWQQMEEAGVRIDSKFGEELLDSFLDSLIDQVREETLKEAEAALPERRVVLDENSGSAKSYSLGFNQARNQVLQTLAALRSLTRHQDQ